MPGSRLRDRSFFMAPGITQQTKASNHLICWLFSSDLIHFFCINNIFLASCYSFSARIFQGDYSMRTIEAK